MRSSSIVLLSGGLDSLASLHWALEESDIHFGLTFHYGQRAAGKEIEVAAGICRHYDIQHKVVEIPWYESMRSGLLDSQQSLPQLSEAALDDKTLTTESAKAVWIPNRNGVFINIAAAMAESLLANWIVVGFNKEEAQTFPDNSQEFVEAANAFLKYSTNGKVLLQAPMGGRTKKEIVQWGLEQGVDFLNLWSCYKGEEKMCGACESCLRLKRALREGGAQSYLGKLF